MRRKTRKSAVTRSPAPTNNRGSALAWSGTSYILIVVVAVCIGFFLISTKLPLSNIASVLKTLSPQPVIIEQNVVRVRGDISKVALTLRKEPIVMLNSQISELVPLWTSTDIVRMMTSDSISGAYRSNHSAIFGTYYDYNRPMRDLPGVKNSIRYESSVTLTRDSLTTIFPPPTHSSSSSTQYLSMPSTSPHYLLATSLSDVNPSLELKLQSALDLASLTRGMSSVNLWLSSPGSTTPCHYDGFYNMYVQLSGSKRFTLLGPGAHRSLNMYPFLHPSFGQCKSSLRDEAGQVQFQWDGNSSLSLWEERVEVILQPGEVLFIPPFWIHEVEALSTSVSLNVWTDFSAMALLQKMLGMAVPGLSSHDLDPFLPVPLTSQEMTALPAALDSLAGRCILGYIIAVEVVEGSVGKARTRLILEDVASRYRHLVEDNTLIDMPSIMREPLAGLLSQWKAPLIDKKKAIKYKEFLSNDALIAEVKEYTKAIVGVFKTLDSGHQSTVMGFYVEFLSERVSDARRASSFVSLLHDAYAKHVNLSK